MVSGGLEGGFGSEEKGFYNRVITIETWGNKKYSLSLEEIEINGLQPGKWLKD